MSKPPEPVSIQAEFSQDAETGEWIATSTQPRMSVRAVEVRRARNLLARGLEERLGKPVEIVDKIKLPKGLADQVATYRAHHEAMTKAREAMDASFLPLVNSLLLARLQLQQIAALLNVSKQWLSQQLKQEATGTYRNTPHRK